MEKINITIPDNLTPADEVKAILGELGKQLAPPDTDNKVLPNTYTVKSLSTQITIIRKPIKEAIATQECSVCRCLFTPKVGKSIWTNYGGKARKVTVCSDGCSNTMIELFGSDRVAVKKKDLQTVKFY